MAKCNQLTYLPFKVHINNHAFQWSISSNKTKRWAVFLQLAVLCGHGVGDLAIYTRRHSDKRDLQRSAFVSRRRLILLPIVIYTGQHLQLTTTQQGARISVVRRKCVGRDVWLVSVAEWRSRLNVTFQSASLSAFEKRLKAALYQSLNALMSPDKDKCLLQLRQPRSWIGKT